MANAEDGDISSHHAHDTGERWSKNFSGKPTTFLRADTINEAAKQRGESFTEAEPGDTRAISKPKKKTQGGVINKRRTGKCTC